MRSDCNGGVVLLSGLAQGRSGKIAGMYESGANSASARDRARHGFAAARTRVVEQLVRAGMPSGTAEPLVDEWLRSTEMLADFRAAPDFWRLAYQFALEE